MNKQKQIKNSNYMYITGAIASAYLTVIYGINSTLFGLRPSFLIPPLIGIIVAIMPVIPLWYAHSTYGRAYKGKKGRAPFFWTVLSVLMVLLVIRETIALVIFLN